MPKIKLLATQRLLIAAALLGLVSTAWAQLSPDEFTAEFIETLKKTNAEVGVENVESLKFVVTTEDGGEHTAFLDNAYNLYLQDESLLQDVMDQYVAALLEPATREESELLAENIVPVVKDSAWLAEVTRIAAEQGQESAPQLFSRPLVDGLTVIYAEDTPSNIRYIQKEDIEKTGVDLATVAELSIENFEHLGSIRLPVGREQQPRLARERPRQLRDELRSNQTPFVVSFLRPRIGEQ